MPMGRKGAWACQKQRRQGERTAWGASQAERRPRSSLSHQAHLPGRQMHGYRKMTTTPRTKARKETRTRQKKETKQVNNVMVDSAAMFVGWYKRIWVTARTNTEDKAGRARGSNKTRAQTYFPQSPFEHRTSRRGQARQRPGSPC